MSGFCRHLYLVMDSGGQFRVRSLVVIHLPPMWSFLPTCESKWHSPIITQSLGGWPYCIIVVLLHFPWKPHRSPCWGGAFLLLWFHRCAALTPGTPSTHMALAFCGQTLRTGSPWTWPTRVCIPHPCSLLGWVSDDANVRWFVFLLCVVSSYTQ